MSDVEPRAIDWLWPDRIPLGKPSVLQGDPKKGKSLLTIDLAARVSAGIAWPDSPNAPNPAGGVVLLSAEDDPEDTIRPRLDAAGADVSRIVVMKGVALPGSNKDWWWTVEDLEPLEIAIREVDARLVVIDPVMAYLPQRINSHNTGDMRSLIGPFAQLAAKCGVAMVLVNHLNKQVGGNAIYRGTGSLALNACARAVWHVAEHPDNRDQRVMVNAGGNLAKDPHGLAFTIVGDDATAPRIQWQPGVVQMSADDVLRKQQSLESKETLSECPCVVWLRESLAAGPIRAKIIHREAEYRGFTKGVLSRARAFLRIKSQPDGVGGPRFWSLPPALAKPTPDAALDTEKTDKSGASAT